MYGPPAPPGTAAAAHRRRVATRVPRPTRPWWLRNWVLVIVACALTLVAVPAAVLPFGAQAVPGSTVSAWGGNGTGAVSGAGGLSGVTGLSAGYGDAVAVKGDGTVVAWGDNSSGQATVPPGSDQRHRRLGRVRLRSRAAW